MPEMPPASARTARQGQDSGHMLKMRHTVPKSEPDYLPRGTADTEKTGTAAMQRIPFRIAGTSMMHRTCRIAI